MNFTVQVKANFPAPSGGLVICAAVESLVLLRSCLQQHIPILLKDDRTVAFLELYVCVANSKENYSKIPLIACRFC